jgi:hypothetical protein
MEMHMKQLMVAAGAAALLAASSLTALAAEATGTIASIDASAGTVTLDDGKSYKMPTTVTLASFMAGQKVLITFEEQPAGIFMASAIKLAPAAGAAAPTTGPSTRPAGTGDPDPGIAGPGAPRPD